MQKKVSPHYKILETIHNRWSPRTFDSKPISEDQVKILLEAGRWAPSSGNKQPWRIIWGLKGTEMYDRIFNCLDDYNQQWAGNSQLLWLNAIKTTMGKGDKKRENFHALHDLGLFMGNVLHQAAAMDLAVHQMAGVRFKTARTEFGFPEEYHVATAVAFGYFGGNPEELPEKLQKEEQAERRGRKSQTEFAFNGNYESISDV